MAELSEVTARLLKDLLGSSLSESTFLLAENYGIGQNLSAFAPKYFSFESFTCVRKMDCYG